MGNFGLPVMNCRYARRIKGLYSDMVSTRSRMARLSTLNPWSALSASDKAIHDINT